MPEWLIGAIAGSAAVLIVVLLAILWASLSLRKELLQHHEKEN